MSSILMASTNNPALNYNILKGMFGLRHQVFSERLGWDVNSHDGMERDGFDDLEPTYMVARNNNQQVEGCWRYLPTTGPYMLKDVFPQLLCGEDAPQDSTVWEISRWAIASSDNSETTQFMLHPVTFLMIRAGYDFARQNNIKHYVVVTSVAMERLLKHAGMPICRFGNKKAQRIGKVLSVACWVDINEQLRNMVYPSDNAIKSWDAAA